MPVAKITSKGQITIPSGIRKLLNLHAGDKISFLADKDGTVTFMPAKKSISELKGIVAKPNRPVSLADAIHAPYQRVNELANKKRGITPSTALRLSRFFDVSAGF